MNIIQSHKCISESCECNLKIYSVQRDEQFSVCWFLDKYVSVDGYVSGCCAPVGVSGVRSGWLDEETFA